MRLLRIGCVVYLPTCCFTILFPTLNFDTGSGPVACKPGKYGRISLCASPSATCDMSRLIAPRSIAFRDSDPWSGLILLDLPSISFDAQSTRKVASSADTAATISIYLNARYCFLSSSHLRLHAVFRIKALRKSPRPSNTMG